MSILANQWVTYYRLRGGLQEKSSEPASPEMLVLIFVERVIAEGGKTALVMRVAGWDLEALKPPTIWRVAEAFSRLFVVGYLSTIAGRCIK